MCSRGLMADAHVVDAADSMRRGKATELSEVLWHQVLYVLCRRAV